MKAINVISSPVPDAIIWSEYRPVIRGERRISMKLHQQAYRSFVDQRHHAERSCGENEAFPVRNGVENWRTQITQDVHNETNNEARHESRRALSQPERCGGVS